MKRLSKSKLSKSGLIILASVLAGIIIIQNQQKTPESANLGILVPTAEAQESTCRPPVEIVFVIDTSGSMTQAGQEWSNLCATIVTIKNRLASNPSISSLVDPVAIYALPRPDNAQNITCQTAFIDETALSTIGSNQGNTDIELNEAWGPGVEWVANPTNYHWDTTHTNTVRFIVPISDTGPKGDVCNSNLSSTQYDSPAEVPASIVTAVTNLAAGNYEAKVLPILGNTPYFCGTPVSAENIARRLGSLDAVGNPIVGTLSGTPDQLADTVVNTVIAIVNTLFDQDRDEHLNAATCANSCPSGRFCDDADDLNKYVNPQVMEGLCEDASNNPINCPSAAPTLLSQSAWQVSIPSGTRQYANCTDYYTAGDVNPDTDSSAPDWLSCTQNTTTVRNFYTCLDTRPNPDAPAYLPADVARAVNAVSVDNNQVPGANTTETSCPKEGGLVPCGRYSDDPATTGVDESTPCGFCHFFQLFDRILSWIMFKIVPAVAVFIVVFGGFMLVISRGNPTQTTLGKNAILYTFIGYAIILVSWLLLNSAFAGIGVKRWTGLKAEEIVLQKTYGKLLWTPKEDLDTRPRDEFEGLALTITGTGDPTLDGQTRRIVKVWHEHTPMPNQTTVDCPDGDPGDLTGTSLTNTHDCIEVDVALPNVASLPGTSKIRIGGWWQFSCGN